MKNKVQCSSCGAMFDDELETCPYCGTIHLRGAEKAYMRDLGRIRDNQVQQLKEAIINEE